MQILYLSHTCMCKILLKLIAHIDVSVCFRGLKFYLSLHLHPYFVCASRNGSGEAVKIRVIHLYATMGLVPISHMVVKLTLYLIETFANRTDPDQAALVRAA